MHVGKANMHNQCIACARSFHAGLTSAEGQKLECFKLTANNIFDKEFENLVNPLSSKVVPVFCLTQALSQCIVQYLWLESLQAAWMHAQGSHGSRGVNYGPKSV
jgi:hypothetical protein